MRQVIDADVEMTDGTAPWVAEGESWDGYAYEVTLTYDGREMATPFYCGVLAGWPTARAVVECMASDLLLVDPDYCRDFEDFCANLGYDTDSRKAERSYRETVKEAKRFARLIGPDLLGWLKAEGDSEAFARRYTADED